MKKENSMVEYINILNSNNVVIFFHYNSLTVLEWTELRENFKRYYGLNFKTIKNSLLWRSCNLKLNGPTCIGYTKEINLSNFLNRIQNDWRVLPFAYKIANKLYRNIRIGSHVELLSFLQIPPIDAANIELLNTLEYYANIKSVN